MMARFNPILFIYKFLNYTQEGLNQKGKWHGRLLGRVKHIMSLL